MSFLYRPTPVIVLSGKTVGSDHVPLRGLPAGTMHGYTPNMISPALNAIGRRTISGDPWLLRSGTMNGFLGQDDGSGLPSDFFSGLDASPSVAPSLPPDFFSGATASPILPDQNAGLPSDFFSGLTASPIVPTAAMSVPVAPNIPNTYSPSGSIVATSPGPAAPSAAPAVAAAAVSAAPSLLQSIGNLFRSTVSPTPMTATQPGVYKATTVTPSWFGQSTLLPGVSNTTALIGGLAVLIGFAAVMGAKK
jgi:hypothetical protein